MGLGIVSDFFIIFFSFSIFFFLCNGGGLQGFAHLYKSVVIELCLLHHHCFTVSNAISCYALTESSHAQLVAKALSSEWWRLALGFMGGSKAMRGEHNGLTSVLIRWSITELFLCSLPCDDTNNKHPSTKQDTCDHSHSQISGFPAPNLWEVEFCFKPLYLCLSAITALWNELLAQCIYYDGRLYDYLSILIEPQKFTNS